jgi:hypothetical protein
MAITTLNDARVAFGIPVGSDAVHWRFMASLMEMQKPPQHGLIIRQGSIIDRSRNDIVRLMLESPAKFTHLLFLDSDMIFPADTLVKLLACDQPIAGGLYYQRIPPFAPVVFNRDAAGNYAQRAAAQLTPGPLSVDACGTGCLLIRRDVLEKLAFPWFAIEWAGGVQRGEDLYFCEKSRQAGIGVTLLTDLVIGHVSSAAVQRSPESLEPQLRVLS